MIEIIISVVLFFVILFCLGFGLLKICKINLDYDLFLSFLIYLGTGLSLLVFLSFVFDIIGIPLHYSLFLFFSLILSGLGLFRSGFNFNFTWKKDYKYYIIVVLFVGLLFFTFYKGAFAYPYLEDDDPWGHAMAVKYIATEKTYNQEYPEQISHYLEPYPPTYDVIMAQMYQINGTVFYTLKMFNVILIALGMLSFFVFVFDIFGIEAATASTIILIALPSYMSHFIWSHTLGLVLFFPAMFTAVKSIENRKWFVPAVVSIGAMMVAHPFVSVLFGIFYIVFVLWNITNLEKFLRSFFIGLFGLLLGMLYWIQQIIRHGLNAVLYSHTGGFGGVSSVSAVHTQADLYINPAYHIMDFLIAPIYTTIDQQTGFGVFAFVLMCCGVIYLLLNWKKYFTKFHYVVLVWLVIGFVGLLGGHLPFSILTHRFWAYVSIPFAIVSGVFVVWLLNRCKGFVFWTVLIILFIGIFGIPFTNDDLIVNKISSWQPKRIAETMQWPPGIAWSTVPELEGYMWMHDNIAGSRVFSLCKEEKLLAGFDLGTHYPNKDVDEFRIGLSEKSVDNIVAFVEGYDYVSLEYGCVKDGYLTEEKLNNLANELSNVFEVVYLNEGIVVYRVNN